MAITTSGVTLIRLKLSKIEKGISQLMPSREMALAKTNLQESSMFLGLVLGDLGQETPYPKSDDKTSVVIETRADVTEDDYNFDSNDYVAMVKEIRSDIATELDVLKEGYLTAHKTILAPGKEPFFATHYVSALTHLEKSKMWLGMCLNDYKLRKDKSIADTEAKKVELDFLKEAIPAKKVTKKK